MAVLVWAEQQHGLTEVADIFTHQLIEDFCSTALQSASEKTRSDYRGRLRPIADSLHPATAPLPAPVAQARYLERYRVLAGAVGLIPADDAWHTE